MAERRDTWHESDVLLRQIDGHLARIRAIAGVTRPDQEVLLAESIAGSLRQLVAVTAQASAADRARVRAAVHLFVVRRDARQDRRPSRPLTVHVRVINEIMHDLGRDDLTIMVSPALAQPV